MKTQLTIGSRGSKLALWQAEWVRARLAVLRPQVEVRIEIIKTSGDVLREVPLALIAGKGVFTKELEEALLVGRIDLAVHSLKDLPTTLPDGLAITAITEREDPRDALVLRADAELTPVPPSIRALPVNAIVGTSSPRRLAQLKYLRPDLQVKELRGNVDTRLRKLDSGDYDAIILAAAGLRRLDLAARISAALAPTEMLPAVSQGALGVETRSSDDATNEVIRLLEHPATRAACTAERSLLRHLGGGCQVPIAAHAVVGANACLRLDALVIGLSGDGVLHDAIEDDAAHAERAGEALAARLRARGAERLLAARPA